MPSLFLLALLGVACVFASSSSSSSSSTSSSTSTTGSGESSGFLRAALVDRAKNPTVKLGFLESDHHDDDDDSLSGSEDDYVRRKARDERRIQAAIQAAANRAAAQPPVKRETYQAKFTRDNDELCLFSTNFPRNNTACFNRQNGPVFFVAKTSASSILDDSFDGNKDGKDDVRGAYENLFNGAGTAQFETLINAFLQQVRNRAAINGGSIKLSALILTGRRPTGQFATFGPNNDLLFSPCFPVLQDADFNIGLWGISQGLNTLYNLNLDYTDFVTPGDDPVSILDDQFKDRVPDMPAKFELIAEDFINPDPLKVDANGDRLIVSGMKVGDVIFEKCTQYSYFQ